MKAYLSLFLTLILFTLAGTTPLHAQQAEPAAAESVESEESAQDSTASATQGDDEIVTAAADPAEDDAGDTPPSREVFNPSVQISEDLSVSFPVDI